MRVESLDVLKEEIQVLSNTLSHFIDESRFHQTW